MPKETIFSSEFNPVVTDITHRPLRGNNGERTPLESVEEPFPFFLQVYSAFAS